MAESIERLGEFIGTHCAMRGRGFYLKDVWTLYLLWCVKVGTRPMGKMTFTAFLEEKFGFHRTGRVDIVRYAPGALKKKFEDYEDVWRSLQGKSLEESVKGIEPLERKRRPKRSKEEMLRVREEKRLREEALEAEIARRGVGAHPSYIRTLLKETK